MTDVRIRVAPRGAAGRVFIRRPVAEDRDELIRNNRKSARFHARLVAGPATAAQFTSFLVRCQRDDFEGLLVCRREDGAIVGVFNLSQIYRGNFGNCYMGYYASVQHARRGYMTEGLALVLDHAFRTLRLHRVEANIQPGNTASIRLVRRAGFAREGYSRRYLKIGGAWRDHERWAILAEDWKRLRRGSPLKRKPIQ
jgi:ribosomal-protein-alanine N-acetyltransferase